jgi:hypothetical protein
MLVVGASGPEFGPRGHAGAAVRLSSFRGQKNIVPRSSARSRRCARCRCRRMRRSACGLTRARGACAGCERGRRPSKKAWAESIGGVSHDLAQRSHPHGKVAADRPAADAFRACNFGGSTSTGRSPGEALFRPEQPITQNCSRRSSDWNNRRSPVAASHRPKIDIEHAQPSRCTARRDRKLSSDEAPSGSSDPRPAVVSLGNAYIATPWPGQYRSKATPARRECGSNSPRGRGHRPHGIALEGQNPGGWPVVARRVTCGKRATCCSSA